MKPERIDIEQARRASGLRLVTLARVPSPWGEALKGILHIKQLPHGRVSHTFGTPTQTLLEWTGQDSFPVLAWNDERPLTRGSISSILPSGWRRRRASSPRSSRTAC